MASALNKADILKDWEWLGNNLFKVLNEMETEEEITNFTICKIQSLVAHSSRQTDDEVSDSNSFRVVAAKFMDLFNMPDDEKLVNYYSCKYVSVLRLFIYVLLIYIQHKRIVIKNLITFFVNEKSNRSRFSKSDSFCQVYNNLSIWTIELCLFIYLY